jgi:hypothetical protein
MYLFDGNFRTSGPLENDILAYAKPRGYIMDYVVKGNTIEALTKSIDCSWAMMKRIIPSGKIISIWKNRNPAFRK